MIGSGKPLQIVDFSTHMSGPLASHLLMEMGADVIKVEHPIQGDGNRGNEPQILGVSDLNLALNSGARSLTVSTRSPHWAEVVAGVTAWADAVIIGSRPKDAVRRGLDYHTLVQANSELVYCVISGFGLAGPWSEYKAHGQTMMSSGTSIGRSALATRCIPPRMAERSWSARSRRSSGGASATWPAWMTCVNVGTGRKAWTLGMTTRSLRSPMP